MNPFDFHAQTSFPRVVSLTVDLHPSDFCIYLSLSSELGQGKKMILIRSPQSEPMESVA